MNEESATGTILFYVALLTLIVLLVDERMIRGALACIPALLLAQRAMGLTESKKAEEWAPENDRRIDAHVREHVAKLLDHFRDFYAMCHLLGSGGISSDEALVRANHLEKDLNRLLDDVTSGTREAAGMVPPEPVAHAEAVP
mgnify:CR=1 FL=1